MKNIVFLLCMLCVLVSCKKELNSQQEIKPPSVDGQLFTVHFSAALFGDTVLPWYGQSRKKDFSLFQHKFLNHVIRLRTSSGTFIIDLPITGSSLHYDLPIGNYNAEVIPICEQSITGNGTYTPFTSFSTSINRAAIYTRSKVTFTIQNDSITTPVILNCITDYACFEFDLKGSTYQIAGVPQPQVINDFDPVFITSHDGDSVCNATYTQLQTQLNNHNLNTVGNAGSASGSWIATNGFWYDNTANIYYMYYIPGTLSSVNIPDGTGNTIPVNRNLVTYLTFDLSGGSGSSYPTFWLKDRYVNKSWTGNTTLRVSYSFGSFQVVQSNWFNSIING